MFALFMETILIWPLYKDGASAYFQAQHLGEGCWFIAVWQTGNLALKEGREKSLKNFKDAVGPHNCFLVLKKS